MTVFSRSAAGGDENAAPREQQQQPPNAANDGEAMALLYQDLFLYTGVASVRLRRCAVHAGARGNLVAVFVPRHLGRSPRDARL